MRNEIDVINPFGARVFFESEVGSTMDVSRALAAEGEQSGTVIAADFQQQGRGRVKGRQWLAERNANLAFTVFLRFPRAEDIPAALTLKAGLAACLAIEEFAPCLQGACFIKWPNDILIGNKKAAGILCEAQGGSPCAVHIGIGVNFAQREFPKELARKAASIANAVREAAGIEIMPDERFVLLEKILEKLKALLGGKDWKNALEQRLYKKGEMLVFIEGAAGSGKRIEGILSGIGDNGELLLIPAGRIDPVAYITGELIF